jgi:hypothetical protein
MSYRIVPPDTFDQDRSLFRFFDLLRVETDPARRTVLRYLALAEEDRYAERQGRLDRVESWICAGAARIARQRELVGRYDEACAFRDSAQSLLTNLEELQGLMITFHGALCDAEKRAGL